MQSGPSSCDTPSTTPLGAAHPDHPPYLQPVSPPGGPNKYLELLGDDVASGSRQAAGRGAAPHVSAATGAQSAGLQYAHLAGASGDSDNPSIGDSPDLPARHCGPRARYHPRGAAPSSAVHYAQLELSDDADTAPDTDSEGAARPDRPRGHHHHHKNHHPSWPSRCNGGQPQYAQIASTDSDTDSEIVDRSRLASQSRPRPAPSPPTPQHAARLLQAAPTGAATSSTSRDQDSSQRGPLTSPLQSLGGGCVGGSPYTTDGYLAPRSVRAAGRGQQASSGTTSQSTC